MKQLVQKFAPAESRVYYRECTILRASGAPGSDLGEREFEFVASNESEDSYGDIVRVDGWDLKRYKSNPIVLFNHSSNMPIGTSTKVWIDTAAKALMARIKVADEGTSDFIDTMFKLMKQKIVRAVSVGFMPNADVEVLRDKQGNYLGLEFNGQELLEISVCSIPANPESLSTAKSLGAKDAVVQRLTATDAMVLAAERQRKIDLLRLGVSSK